MNKRNQTDVEEKIHATLLSINDTSLKITNELTAINGLLKMNGQLHTAVIGANKELTAVAEDMNINVEELLNDEEGSGTKINLQNTFDFNTLTQKLLNCIHN